MSKKRKKKKFPSPIFANLTQRDCFRFILEEEQEAVKKDYEIAGKKFKEVDWTYEENYARFVVYLNEKNEIPQMVYFPIENYPLLVSFWKHLNTKDAQI